MRGKLRLLVISNTGIVMKKSRNHQSRAVFFSAVCTKQVTVTAESVTQLIYLNRITVFREKHMRET